MASLSIMLTETPAISSDLDWMMQSSQVKDELLIQALWEEYAKNIYLLALYLTGDKERARLVLARSFVQAVKDRHKYWGEHRLKVWLFALTVAQYRRGNQVSANSLKKAQNQVELQLLPTFKNTTANPNALLVERLVHLLEDLDQKEILYAFCRYPGGLNIEEIGYVFGADPGDIR